MSPRLAFWTFAWFNFSAIVACALVGFRQLRGRPRSERAVALHRRWMSRASWLVVVFLLAYAAKVVVLGREDLSLWSAGAVATLRLHEVVVAVMLVTGGGARYLAFRHGKNVPRLHPRLGRIALWAGIAALVTATAVLVGMHARATFP